MDLRDAIDMAPLYRQLGLMFLFIVIPVIIGIVVFRKLRNALFKLAIFIITIIGLILYLFFGFANPDVWRF